jgi:tRNA 5-methylaminomethyl-2-thiouridine biosynthesis bifunctional protein
LKNNDLFEIHSDKNLIFTADIVVISNANDAKYFSQTKHFKTQAVRGQISLLSATDTSRKLQSIVCSDGYLSPVVNGQHCLGATFSSEKINLSLDDLNLDDQDHLTNLETLKIISEPLHQNLQENITGGRVSLRCTTSDYFPLVGELLDTNALKMSPPRPTAPIDSLPWLTGLYINIAHGSKGFTIAPLCAELLASLICNEALPVSTEIAVLLNPNRFILREMGLKRLAKTMAFSS